MKISPKQFAKHLDRVYGIVDTEGMPVDNLVMDLLQEQYPYHEIELDEAYDDSIFMPLVKDLRFHALSLENEGQSLFVVGRHNWHKICLRDAIAG